MKNLMMLASLVMALFLQGCATNTPINVTDFDAVSKHIAYKDDPFSGTKTFTAPIYTYPLGVRDVMTTRGNGVVEYINLAMMSFKDGTRKYAITFVDVNWKEPRHFYQAFDSDQKSVEIKAKEVQVSHCNNIHCKYIETATLPLSRDYLDSHKESGILIKLYGKNGDEIIGMHSNYIKAFLQTTDDFLGKEIPLKRNSLKSKKTKGKRRK